VSASHPPLYCLTAFAPACVLGRVRPPWMHSRHGILERSRGQDGAGGRRYLGDNSLTGTIPSETGLMTSLGSL
jgi:hypothetical protein